MEHNQENNQGVPPLSRRERRELKRQKKMEGEKLLQRKKTLKRMAKIASIVAIVGGGIGAFGWYIAIQPKTPPSEIISRSGIHWHPELSISIRGEKQEISANIGLGAVHKPVHTHDTTGVLHLEVQGFVTKENTTLGRFFKIWGKQFNANCIFDSCNGSGGTVTLFVNGQEHSEFENYAMHDKDKIEIRYE